MKVVKIRGFKCPHCDNFIEELDIPKEVNRIAYQCGECEGVYEDREEAVECCKEQSMSYTERYCHRCSHWKWAGKGEAGYCAIYSCACATAIFNRSGSIPRFLEAEDAVDLPKQKPEPVVKIDIEDLYRKLLTLSR